MKHTMKTLSLLSILALSGISSSAMAAPKVRSEAALNQKAGMQKGGSKTGRTGDSAHRRDRRRARDLQRFDKNRDGVLSPAEAERARRAHKVERWNKMLGKLDTNGDRAISKAEMHAGMSKGFGKNKNKGKRYGQGKGRGHGHGHGKAGMHKGRRGNFAARFASIDKNGDGVITRSEFLQHRHPRRGKPGKRG